jgi:hypothetical protein
MYQTGKLANDCKRLCTSFNTTGHVNLTEFETDQDFRTCTFYDENQCRFRFVYSDNFGEGLKVHAQNVSYYDFLSFLTMLMFPFRIPDVRVQTQSQVGKCAVHIDYINSSCGNPYITAVENRYNNTR